MERVQNNQSGLNCKLFLGTRLPLLQFSISKPRPRLRTWGSSVLLRVHSLDAGSMVIAEFSRSGMENKLSDPPLTGNTGTPRISSGISSLCSLLQDSKTLKPCPKLPCSSFPFALLDLTGKKGFGTSFSKDEAKPSTEMARFSLTGLLRRSKGQVLPFN